jgi:hypothetical protein
MHEPVQIASTIVKAQCAQGTILQGLEQLLTCSSIQLLDSLETTLKFIPQLGNFVYLVLRLPLHKFQSSSIDQKKQNSPRGLA